jgi:hypothetical protein
MHNWTKRLFVAAAPLLLASCLWGPGKFNSDLTLRKDGSFVLDYRGEIVLQIPDEQSKRTAWSDDKAHCYLGEEGAKPPPPMRVINDAKSAPKERPCSKAEIASQRAAFEKNAAELADQEQKKSEEMAKMFGLPGLDDASNRAFAAKLQKYAGWRSVTYRGKGVFNVDYHFEGKATQDFLFPALPDNDLLIPFIAIRRRTDGSVLVTAPAMTGGAGPLAARMPAAMAGDTKTDMVSHAQGRFTVITDGEILTNNSEDGAAPHPVGRQVHWDVGPASNKIPETLIRL